MAAYTFPYLPVFAWQLDSNATATYDDGSPSAVSIASADTWGFGVSGGDVTTQATASTDSLADAVADGLAALAAVASATGYYVWPNGATPSGNGPQVRVDFVLAAPTSTAPTFAATGASASLLGITSTVTATARAATPTTDWRFQFGPCDGFWWPAQRVIWDGREERAASFASAGFGSTVGEVVTWGSAFVERTIELPYVYAAYVSLYRLQDSGYADVAGRTATPANNLLDNLIAAAREGKSIRTYRTVSAYRTGKLLAPDLLRDGTAKRSDVENRDALAAYALVFRDADGGGL